MSKILETIQGGNKQSNNLIVFLQGWPDNAVMWDWINWKEQLSTSHLLFINFPNTNGKVDEKWGRDFPQLISDIKYTLDSQNIQPKNKILVAHDWGCYYGYLFDEKHPKYFSQIIAMDVPGKIQLTSIKQIIFVITYQLILAFAFIIGGKIGKFITQSMTKVFHHQPPYFQHINSSQNYPYFYLFKNILLSTLKIKSKYLTNYKPSVPCTYLYAARKPFQFHGDQWLKIVQDSGGEVHRMDAGHWFMKKYAKTITDLISKKLKK